MLRDCSVPKDHTVIMVRTLTLTQPNVFSRIGPGRLLAAIAVIMSCGTHAVGQAPRADVIRGRVTGPDTIPIAGAQVVATDSVAKTQKPTRTDSLGAFSISMERGSGTYIVVVNMLGFAPERRLVRRASDGIIPVVEFKLSQAATMLGPVRSVGQRPKAIRSDVTGDFSVGGQINYVNQNNGLTGDLTGDPTLALATIAGVTILPSATGGLPTVSAFGIAGDQNGSVLNGMGFGGNVPRDGFRIGVVTSSYDPGRGGFAGLQTTVRMQQGSNLVQRSIHTTLDAPSLQWTTPVATQLATRYGQQIASGTASGPMVADHVFYSTAFQFQRRANGLTSLASADRASLEALRVSPDSVTKLLGGLTATGIPIRTSGVPDSRENTETRLAVRLDWVPRPTPPPAPGIIFFGGQNPTQDAYYLQAGGTARNSDGAMINAMSIPSFGGNSTHRDGWAQFTGAMYLPKSVLDEATISVSGSADQTVPYLDLPSARILVASALANGESGLATLQVGGNSQARSHSRNWQTELRNQTSWFTWDRRHSLSLTMSAAAEGYSIAQDAGYGSYFFNSLSDFTSGLPASYSRTLTGRSSGGRGFTGAVGIGDTYVTRGPAKNQSGPSSPPLTVQYGVRVEGNHFSVHPGYNSQVDSAFGLRTDHVPSTIAVMPMFGFRASFLTSPRGAAGIFSGPRLNVSGGVREYRGSIAARTIDSYSQETGLPDAIQQLYCIGRATPASDWRTFEASTRAIPTQCADGTAGSPLAQHTSPVMLFAPDYELFESWRPQLNATYQLNQSFSLSLGGTYARNRHLPGLYDVNFRATPVFLLPAEGGRPVYVSQSSIVPGTGAEAWTESRVSPLFGHVAESRSDLRSETRALSATLNYFSFSLLPGNSWSANVGYTYSDSREQYRGFATTSGDPTTVGWSRGIQAKHVVTVNVGRHVERLGNLTLFGRLQSGQPYTPLVVGDINGDGYANDRPFIFKPGGVGVDANVSTAVSQLLATAPSNARACLSRQLGTIVGRNSCVGPWAFANLSMQLSPDPYRIHLGNRGSLSLFVNNILSGLDQAVHGASRAHGWGQGAIPDPALLTVRGFDPASRQFKYAVNPLFGSTAVFRNAFRQPLTLTIDFRVDIAPDRESQYLESILSPRKVDTLKQLSEAQIKQRIMRGSNPVDQITSLQDSLRLTDTQVESMRKLGQRFSVARDSIAREVARFLALRNGDYGGEEVRRVWHSAGIATYTVFFRTMKSVIAILTPEQQAISERLPQTAGLLLQSKTLNESDLRWLFRMPMSSLP